MTDKPAHILCIDDDPYILKVTAGSLEISYELWKYIAATTANDALREKAQEYMQDLELAIQGKGPVPEWARRRRVVNGRASR